MKRSNFLVTTPDKVYCSSLIFLKRIHETGEVNQEAPSSDPATRVNGEKGCLHREIATVIYFLQLLGCMGFSLIVAITPSEHLH